MNDSSVTNYIPVDDMQLKNIGWDMPVSSNGPPSLGEDMGFDLVRSIPSSL